MKLLIEIAGCISLFIGLVGSFFYLSHPLSGTKYAEYTGWKFYIFAFICAALIYLKG